MKSLQSIFALLFLSSAICFAQPAKKVQHSFNDNIVLTLGGGLAQGQTDYLDTKWGLNFQGSLEYFFSTTGKSIFSLRLGGGYSQIEGKVNLVSAPESYKTQLFNGAFGATYNYNFENKVFPYIYGGLSYIFYYPKLSGPHVKNNPLVVIDNTENSLAFESELGVRILLSRTVSLTGGLGFHFLTSDNLDFLIVNTSNNDFYLSSFVGLSFSLFTEKDSDGDGYYDNEDQCPNEAEDFDGFQDYDGCPDLDNDNDGIPDISDACPNKAEDKDGYMDEDGCPDLDNDNDGIPDVKDLCPNQPEDKDGFEDSDGCPDLDNDKDGIPDNIDQCPNEPETFNGYKDSDGCPDIAPKVEIPKPVKKPKPKTKQKTKNKQKPKKVNINAPSQFLLHGESIFIGRTSTIRSQAYSELNKIAQIIKKYPSTRWRIEGHMDNQGTPEQIRTISIKRARAVYNYFVSKGIPGSRLQVVGMGDSVPLTSNSTAYGRMRNRRIVIVRIK